MNPNEPKPTQPLPDFSETAPLEETAVVVPPSPSASPAPQNEPPPVAQTVCFDSFSLAKQEEEVEGLPGALMAAPTQPGSAGIPLRDPWRVVYLTPARVAALGLVLGLGLGIWLYLRPWPLERPFSPPVVLSPEPLPALGQAGPPRQWVWEAEGWFGRDGAGGLWMHQAGRTRRAEGPVPDIIHPGRFCLAGRPPLEPATTLAWIQEAGAAAATSATLRVAHFDLATSAAAALDIPLALPLPAGSYPYAPIAIDHPDPQTGLLLVASEARGMLTAWRLGVDAPAEPVWRYAPENSSAGFQPAIHAGKMPALPSAPRLVCPPCAVLEWPEGKAVVKLLVLTSEEVATLDGGTGKPVGAPVRWLAPLAADRTVTLARVPNGGGSAWLVSDGKRLEMITGSADVSSVKSPGSAGVLARSGYALPQDLGPAPRLLSLPHPHTSGPDDIVAIGADGRTAWLSGSSVVAGPKLPESLGDPAAIDLNGDFWWDLAGVGRDGTPWTVDGQKRELCSSPRASKGASASRPGGSGVRWALAEQAGKDRAKGAVLEAYYLDGEGRACRVQWPLAGTCDVKQSGYYLRSGM